MESRFAMKKNIFTLNFIAVEMKYKFVLGLVEVNRSIEICNLFSVYVRFRCGYFIGVILTEIKFILGGKNTEMKSYKSKHMRTKKTYYSNCW